MESSLVERPKISVTMPVYRSAPLVCRAIESVLSQDTSYSFELLVWDDASPDHAWDVIKKYRDDSRFRCFRNFENLGCAATRQKLLGEVRGEYVSICDSDDELLSGNLERFARILDSNPDKGVVYGDLLEVETDRFGQELAPRWRREFVFERPWDLMHNLVPHPGTMARTALVRQVGGYRDLPNSCDWDLWLRMAEVTSFHYDRGFAACLYRRWPDTITRRPNNREEIALRIVQEAVRRRSRNGDFERHRDRA